MARTRKFSGKVYKNSYLKANTDNKCLLRKKGYSTRTVSAYGSKRLYIRKK